MTTEEKHRLLSEEYIQLQGTIGEFDAKALTIKAWSITASLAGFGAAFAVKAPEVFLLSGLSSLLFWFLEGRWKTFQLPFYERARVIEKYFQHGGPAIDPFQIGRFWWLEHKKGGLTSQIGRLCRAMCWTHVALPHIFVFVTGLILFGLERLKLLEL